MIVYKKNKNFALRSESVTAVLALGSTESVGFVLERSRFQLDFRPNTFVVIMIDLSNDHKVNIKHEPLFPFLQENQTKEMKIITVTRQNMETTTMMR